jgi:hypothetical protein
MGLIYQNGWGVNKDIAEAKRWFQKAADQGNAGSRIALQKLNNGQ